MEKKQSALAMARSAIKKAEGANTPDSIKAKLKNAGNSGKHKAAKTKVPAKKKRSRGRV